MKRLRTVLVVGVVSVALFGCVGAPEESVVSRYSEKTTSSSDGGDAPEREIVWIGTGSFFLHTEEGWVRTPESDYDFLVYQQRYSDRWESLKVQNRTHPGYDGSAGPSDQQHFFAIHFGAGDNSGTMSIDLRSTLGAGTGRIDTAYRNAVLEFEAANAGRFAPYNRFRITQEYRYGEGLLVETVELLERRDDGTEVPFAKIEERARIFTPHRSSEPQT